MKPVSPLNYAFAIGKIRAMEKSLIRAEVFEEAIESNLSDALRLFAESEMYSSELLHVKDGEQLERILNQELFNLKKLMRELILDKGLLCLVEMATLKGIYQTCRCFTSEFLNTYLTYLLDMHNIKTFLRLYVLKEPIEILEKALTREGFIKKTDFLSLYPQDLTALLNKLEYVHLRHRTVDYTYYLGSAIQKAIKENSFVSLEKAIRDFLMLALKPAKYITFGPEPILAYYFARVNEIDLIRLIILAKLNEVTAELVKERLNEAQTY